MRRADRRHAVPGPPDDGGLGIGWDGRKTVLGLREGATENATVVSELLSDLAGRGLDFGVPRLYVLDGSKALAAAAGCRGCPELS